MTRTKLADRTLPNYSRKEEWINSISHMVGGAFGIFTLISCVFISLKSQDILSLISSIIYGSSMIFLYTMSSIYHGLNTSTAKKVFQIIDHCAVFVLIAGTYTPILLCAVKKINSPASNIMLCIVWGVTALGIVFNSIDLKKHKVFSMICYIAIGWVIIVEIYPLYLHFGMKFVALLFSGGLCYTVGAILYGIGKKKKYFHSVFHFFVLAGSILQYFSIALYIL